jgi:hypothetical protein
VRPHKVTPQRRARDQEMLDYERMFGRCPCTSIAILRRGLPVLGAIGIQSDAHCVSECVTGAECNAVPAPVLSHRHACTRVRTIHSKDEYRLALSRQKSLRDTRLEEP